MAAESTSSRNVNFIGGTINSSISKKFKTSNQADIYKQHLTNFMKAEYADTFVYVFVAGGAVEANRMFFDMITRKFACVANRYPHVIVGDSQGMQEHGNYCCDLDACKMTHVMPHKKTRQYSIKSQLRQNTCLVSVAITCEKTGEIRDMLDIADKCKRGEAIFHVDISDAIGYTSFHPKKMGINAFTMDFSKLGGPIGMAVLAMDRELVGGYGLKPVDGNISGGIMSACFYAFRAATEGRKTFISAVETLKTHAKERFSSRFGDNIEFLECATVISNVLAVQFPNEMELPDNIFISEFDDNIFKLEMNPNNTLAEIDFLVESFMEVE